MFKSVLSQHEPHPDAIAVTAFSDAPQEKGASKEVIDALKRAEWTGEIGQVVEAYPADSPRIYVVGLGPKAKFNSQAMRKAAAALARRCAQHRIHFLRFDFKGEAAKSEMAQACGEAFGLLSWTSGQFRSKADDRPDISLNSVDESFLHSLRHGLALASCQNYARTLGNTPPNIATPGWMADQAGELGRLLKMDVKVIEYKDLIRHKLLGIHTVGRASDNKPCFVRIEYAPEGATGKPVVLVGKTLTYDTGGLSLKDRAGMVGMKTDKCGGCAVLGTMRALKNIQPNVRVVALLSVAENSVSSNAFRPDDVITYMNGKTVEVTNTDAEGRLVLADALCWAYAKEDPDVVIDVATLTGGVWVALGAIRGGLFCDDPTLTEELLKAGEATGEKVWPLPMDVEYDETMKSTVADLVNSGASRGGHPVQGAVFLRNFTEDSAPWAHLDIAGMAATDTDAGYYTKGATGFGVRLLSQFLATRYGSAV